MAKLDIRDFETLQEGLRALRKKSQGKNIKENKKTLKRIRDAREALIIVGIY
jgi:hypothetical protein